MNKKAQMTVVLSVLYLKAPPKSTSAEAKEWLGVVGKRNEEQFTQSSTLCVLRSVLFAFRRRFLPVAL